MGARGSPLARPAWAAATLAVWASPVCADPCKAIPDRGPMPPEVTAGRRFEGPVVYVGDGDSLCVALGASPERWVEVRLADVYAPELHEPEGMRAKALLEQITMGRRLSCIAGKRSYDRVVATCRVEGRRLQDRLRAAGAPTGGRGQR